VEAATIEQVERVEPAARAAAGAKMFRYSAYIDVGDGAQDCGHARDGECKDIEHFHAWVRLPNPFQQEDIRAKAMAAQARQLRELRDPDSDAAVVLEHMLSMVGDRREQIIAELLAGDHSTDFLQAQRDVDGREEFEHIAQDREEYERLATSQNDLPVQERSAEFKALDAHLAHYLDARAKRLEEIQAPRRAELDEQSLGALVDRLRTKRADEAAWQAFMETYNPWTWFVGTYRTEPHPTLGRPYVPMWDQIGHKDRAAAGTMYGEATEIIEALDRAFTELRTAMFRGSAGN
jgi:hypothetical protein